MTAPPDEKGYDASIQALLNAFPMADKMAAMYAEAAIRAYLAASPSPSEMDVARKLRERSGFMREAGHDDDAELDLEAADALDQAQSALAAMRAERDEAIALLDHLIGWIVHDCGAEVPFTDSQDAAYKALKENAL